MFGNSVGSGSSPFTPPVNSGRSTTGGAIRLPFSSTPVVPIGPLYPGFSACTSGSPLTPPLNSGISG